MKHLERLCETTDNETTTVLALNNGIPNDRKEAMARGKRNLIQCIPWIEHCDAVINIDTTLFF